MSVDSFLNVITEVGEKPVTSASESEGLPGCLPGPEEKAGWPGRVHGSPFSCMADALSGAGPDWILWP